MRGGRLRRRCRQVAGSPGDACCRHSRRMSPTVLSGNDSRLRPRVRPWPGVRLLGVKGCPGAVPESSGIRGGPLKWRPVNCCFSAMSLLLLAEIRDDRSSGGDCGTPDCTRPHPPWDLACRPRWRLSSFRRVGWRVGRGDPAANRRLFGVQTAGGGHRRYCTEVAPWMVAVFEDGDGESREQGDWFLSRCAPPVPPRIPQSRCRTPLTEVAERLAGPRRVITQVTHCLADGSGPML